jgi:hypothetical protein
MHKTYQHVLLLYGVLFVIGLATVSGFIEIAAPTHYLYTSDGITYAEVARNILAGKGISATPFAPEPYGVDLEPLRIFQPGYPILIAAFAALGIQPENLVVWLSVGAWVLLFPAFAFALRPLLPPLWTAVFSYIAATSSGMFAYGFAAFTDAPSLLLIVISFGLLLRGLRSDNMPILLASGFFAASAYAMRNTGAAFLISVGAVLVGYILIEPTKWKKQTYLTMIWVLGTLPIIALLWGRNFVLFGGIQTYSHPPADTPPVLAIRDYLWHLIFEVAPNKTIAQLAWDIKLLLAIGLPALVFMFINLRKQWPHLQSAGRTAVLVLSLYLLVGSAMVIYAHIKWDAEGFDRYVLQYGWLFLALLFIAFNFNPSEKISLLKYILAGVAVSALLIARWDYAVEYAHQPPNVREVLAKDRHLIQAVKNLPANALIATNLIGFLPLETGRPIRNIEFKSSKGIDSYISNLNQRLNQIADGVGQRPFYAAILPTKDIVEAEYGKKWYLTLTRLINTPGKIDPAWQTLFLEGLSGKFYVVDKTPTMLLIASRPINQE